MRIPHYQRYMDDLTLLTDSPAQLADARDALAQYLDQALGLSLKAPLAQPQSTHTPVVYLGHRVTRAGVTVGAAGIARMKRWLRA